MPAKLSRRQFLKLGAASGLSAAMMPLFNSLPAFATPRIPERVQQTLAAAAVSLPTSLPLGAPLADIAKGWDGNLLGIDTNGVPHQFDQLSQQWRILGSGFDVIARADNSSYILFRGPEVMLDYKLYQLSDLWQNLPDSFALGVDGAANIRGTIYLFRNGRFLTIDPSTKTASAPKELTSLAGWPTGANWAQGAITAVGSNGTTIDQDLVLLWAKDEYIWVNLSTRQVIEGPHSLHYYVTGQMYVGMSQGFTTMLWDETNYSIQAFNGPVRWHSANRDGTAYADYVNPFYPAWAPLLRHAPSGQNGDLWAAGRVDVGVNYHVYHYDGTQWEEASNSGLNSVEWVSAGNDETVFVLSNTGLGHVNLCQYDATSDSWSQVASGPSTLSQLAVGNTATIWARDSTNNVYRRNGTGFSTITVGHQATSIAAGSDGTLWHTAGDSNVYRYIPEGSQPSSALGGLTNGALVSTVAGTGFGEAYLLTKDGTLRRYDSPYVFKTSKAYYTQQNQWWNAPQAVVAAGHTVFLGASNSQISTERTITALDAQSGTELWHQTFPVSNSSAQPALLYDELRQLLYVANELTIRALDLSSGAVRWTLDASGALGTSILVGLALSGNRLCVSHMSGRLVLIDLDDAIARGQQNQPAQSLWVSPAPQIQGYPAITAGIPTFDANGTIYGQASRLTAALLYECLVFAINPATGVALWQQVLSGGSASSGGDSLFDLVLGETYQAGTTTRVAALFVNSATEIYALNPQTGATINSFSLPHGSVPVATTSTMAYLNDRIYVGDNTGKLYVLNALTLKIITTTTDSDPRSSDIYRKWKGVLGSPQLISGKTAEDGLVVAFSRGEDHVWLFDPESGSMVSVSTDQTMGCALDYDTAHGLLYTMGWMEGSDSTGSTGQVFALRPDSFIQDERSFVIDSELLQDYGSDEEAAGDGVSRYQTHVTIVDASKAPRAGQAVKLWADEDGIVVKIDGDAYTIGPNTPALFTTDGTGSFTIMSDANDLAAVSLRIWSPFMDEHERLTITPDAAFHQRLATTSATGNSDPQQIDMLNAQSYDGTPLFTDNGQAQQAATAITQLTSSVGMGTGVGAQLAQSNESSSYIAYPNLAGVAYTPVNVAVNQDVSGQVALGLSLSSAGHATLTPAQAAALIDQMEGEPHQLLGGFLSSLKSAWQEIKQTAAKVEQVVVSVAKDVYAGIVYVVNGVKTVVKAVVQDIKDAAAAIGAFFVQLGKDLLKVVQALSKFLRLDKVFATAKIIRDDLKATLSNLGPVLTQGQGILDGWLSTAEQEINDSFCKLYTTIGLPGCGSSGGGSLGTTQGMGATASSVYNSGSDGTGSQAVECGWSSHTLRNNVDQASSVNTVSALASDPAVAMESLVNSFIDKLSSDPQLSAALSSVRNSFSNTFKVNSPDAFFKYALQDILEIFRMIAVSGVAIGKALIDTLLSAVDTLVQGLLNLGNVKIPVLSVLWHKLTGQDLTLLDLISFVMAFPVTFIYRAVDGSYPGDTTLLQASAGSTVLNRVMSLAGGVGLVVGGVMTAYIDTLAVFAKGIFTPGKVLRGIGGLLLVVNVSQGIIKAALQANAQPSLIGLATTTTISAVLTVTAAKSPQGLLWGNFILNAFNLAFFRWKQEVFQDDTLTMTREVLGTLPALVAPTKLDGYPVGLLVPVADLACRWAAGGIQLAQTIEAWIQPGEEESEPAVYTSYLPMVGR